MNAPEDLAEDDISGLIFTTFSFILLVHDWKNKVFLSVCLIIKQDLNVTRIPIQIIIT